MKYLLNISKRRAFWSLNENILKISILKTNMSYPSRKIRRIRACTHQRPRRKQAQYVVQMDDPNITMEEYIRLEEEKAHRRGKVYNWKTTTYGKIWDNEDIHDLRSIKTEFPAIVFNNTLTFKATLSCEPTVSIRRILRNGYSVLTSCTVLVIMEYLVNISKRRPFWSLNEDILKITTLKTNTSYPSRKIRRIRACTHQRVTLGRLLPHARGLGFKPRRRGFPSGAKKE
nr:hypothetical protein [Tanacetum cinerariifolium]